MHTYDEAIDDNEEKNTRMTSVGMQSQLNICASILSLFQKPEPESSLLPTSKDGDQEQRLVSGTKAKNEILEKYQTQFGSSSGKPIVSTKKVSHLLL